MTPSSLVSLVTKWNKPLEELKLHALNGDFNLLVIDNTTDQVWRALSKQEIKQFINSDFVKIDGKETRNGELFVSGDDIKTFEASKGLASDASLENLFDQNSGNYSEELEIAIKARIYIDENGFKGKLSPKDQIIKWIKSNYSINSESAIDRIATIVNPANKKKGGATRSD